MFLYYSRMIIREACCQCNSPHGIYSKIIQSGDLKRNSMKHHQHHWHDDRHQTSMCYRLTTYPTKLSGLYYHNSKHLLCYALTSRDCPISFASKIFLKTSVHYDLKLLPLFLLRIDRCLEMFDPTIPYWRGFKGSVAAWHASVRLWSTLVIRLWAATHKWSLCGLNVPRDLVRWNVLRVHYI